MAKKVVALMCVLFILTVSVVIVGGFCMGIFDSKKSFTYKECFDRFDNPYIGYAPDAGYEELCEKYQLVYLNLLWSELEPDEGDFRWDEIEEKYNLGRWRAAGKHLVLRFVCDIPTGEEHMDIPSWLYDKTMDGKFYDIEYGKGYSPNYDNETFIEEHARVIAEIGRYFSSDGFLCYVELGSLGHWGEWHTYYSADIPRIPKTEVRKRYVEAYEKAFPYARLLMRRPFAERPKGTGVFNDMTGSGHDTFLWLNWIEIGGEYDSTGEANGIVAVPEIWKEAPVGGEFTSSIPISIMLGQDYEETLRMIERSHMSFIGPMIPDVVKNPDVEEASDKLLSVIGYRYRIKSLTLNTPFMGKETTLSATVINDGASPIYFKRKACLYVDIPDGIDKESLLKYCSGMGREGTDAEGMLRFDMKIDLMSLSGGEEGEYSVTIPKEILDLSGVKIYAGIEGEDPKEPAVLLSMKEERKGCLTLLMEK